MTVVITNAEIATGRPRDLRATSRSCSTGSTTTAGTRRPAAPAGRFATSRRTSSGSRPTRSSGAPGGRTPDEHAAALRDHSPAELAAQLRASVDGLRAFLERARRRGVERAERRARHDARARRARALVRHVGAPRRRHAPRSDSEPIAVRGSRPSVAYLAAQRCTKTGGVRRRSRSTACRAIDIGAGGPKITGDPYQFVLVASGRADPATLGLDATVNIYRTT